MHIHDYESGRDLRDVNITLSRDEAEEMVSYLHALLKNPHINHITLNEIKNAILEKEISFSVAS